MKVVTDENCMSLILERFPDFQSHWKTYLDYWNDEKPGLWTDMSEFSHYVIGILEGENLEALHEVPKIFEFIEYLIVSGDDNVQNAVVTCFLENILNRVPTSVNPKKFIPYLGKRSRFYCREWDEFTGVKTDGL